MVWLELNTPAWSAVIGLLPDTQHCGLCIRRECRERFPRHRLQMKPLVKDPEIHHGTCVTHVPCCMSGSLTRGVRGKRSWYSRRMHNPQFYVSGKRLMRPYQGNMELTIAPVGSVSYRASNCACEIRLKAFLLCANSAILSHYPRS